MLEAGIVELYQDSNSRRVGTNIVGVEEALEVADGVETEGAEILACHMRGSMVRGIKRKVTKKRWL